MSETKPDTTSLELMLVENNQKIDALIAKQQEFINIVNEIRTLVGPVINGLKDHPMIKMMGVKINDE
jgi:hypothetical protein